MLSVLGCRYGCGCGKCGLRFYVGSGIGFILKWVQFGIFKFLVCMCRLWVATTGVQLSGFLYLFY